MSAAVTGASPRFSALQEANNRTTRVFDWARNAEGHPQKVTEFFGVNTFNDQVMRQRLPKKVYSQLQETIKRGGVLDKAIADVVAHAVKEWAVEAGATHFCHWFQPQTGLIAEKHDAFLDFDDEGNPIERFSGSQLIQSEPDASSFPSGGLRSTFEARGYTIWDPSSPIFILDKPTGKTLCVPSVFISYYGQALDQKAPLLRSIDALNKSALSILRLFGNTTATRVFPTVGVEQEYFLIDRAFYSLRPDLVSGGRTVIGSKPPKGQELEDHYFGALKQRVQSFMNEVEYELYKLGVPVKTRHNEVAPSQFEIAPVFEPASVAADHNQIVMETMRSVARLHNFAALLHEKPFAGVNGSGKHNNWSMQDSEGNNLLNPGNTPSENLQFLVFLAAVLKGVQRRAGLLRMSIATSGNDHRLGANEAPPAIISVYLGDQLSRVLDNIDKGTASADSTEERVLALGINHLPAARQDNTDRNRTSPFAFTGNKFEFRAVGSSASISLPLTILNAATAEALSELNEAIVSQTKSGANLSQAVIDVVRKAVTETRAVRYEGNGYSPEWVDEAERRGLPNLRKTPEAVAEMIKPEAIDFFERTGIFSGEEAQSRYHVLLERYLKDCEIEIQVLKDMIHTQIFPAAYEQQELLASSTHKLMATLNVGADDPAVKTQINQLRACAKAIATLQERLDQLDEEAGAFEHSDDLQAQSVAMAYKVLPAMDNVREVCDQLEDLVADHFWPLPKYREMLFLS